ncbi:sialidase family protein [Roseimicrobium sp. ORNL1]|uniref:sialidase family protein n=1 Tax=Roseimicrobium sp. ORNL1 TaxID=2711231 RepID=UPI0013E1C7D7|nr:sialidase family protein [Roseimicrobium sp. ORNL1]QIF01437.1 hypothetical protein G5S37_07850 [Roseimicrobium sp. ORNL1]
MKTFARLSFHLQLPLLCLTASLLPHASTLVAADEDDGLAVPKRIRDMAMEPSFINTNPGPEYSDEQRDYAMVIGMDRTQKGRLWAAWVAGGDSDLGYFVLGSSDDNGATWSKPRLVIDPPEAPTGLRKRILVGNLWTDPTGKLWLFYDQSMGYYDGRAGVWAITCDNPDAETPIWSKPRRIWHGLTLNKPLVLKNGEWLLPISLWGRGNINPPELRDAHAELDDMRMAHLFVSKDQGATWTRRGGVAVPQTQFDEHMFVELNDGRLWMLVRTNYGIAETFSSDQGATWSEPQPSTLQNPSARFHLRKLASGRILLVKNGPLNERTGRTLMTAYLTEDEGKTWKGGLVIDERNGVSYPDGFQAPDGTINIIHDRERAKEREILMARFTEEDILAGKLVSPGSQTKMLVSKALGTTIGEVTYNGLRNPGEWPPKTQDPKSFEPMTVPWLEDKNKPDVIPITFGRQLFVDDFLIEETNLKRTYHEAEKYEGNPVFKPETPFELAPTGADGNQQAVCYLGHGGVFWEPQENLFKMFYTAGWRGGLAVATSPDLINWTRPDLKLAGGNLLLPPGRKAVGGDNSVWLDINAKNPKERIKYLTDRGPHTLQTSDGVKWSDPVPMEKSADYCSIFYNPFRHAWVYSIKQGGPHGRSRYYAESRDFMKGDWKKSVYWTNADRLDEADPKIGDAPQLYSLNAVAYESILLGEFYIHLGPDNKICDEGKFPKITEIKLGFSRDGFHWHRPDRRAFIGASQKDGTYDRGYIHGTTGVCAVIGDKLYFPFTAYSGIAPNGVRGMYTGATVGVATLRRDGFASMDAGDALGNLTTKKVAFNGRHLFVNTDAWALSADILDETGKPIPPFTRENCELVRRSQTCAELKWKGAANLDAVRGKPVKFHFELTRGSLYSFWVSQDGSGASRGYVGAGGPGFTGNTDTVGEKAVPSGR